MIDQVLLATAFALGLTSFAATQAALAPSVQPTPPLGGDAATAPGDMPPQPSGKGPRRGPLRPPPVMKGIGIRMGRDMGLRVECRNKPMQAYLMAAKPLTDKIPNLTMPLAPPMHGNMPMTPASGDAPTPPPAG